MSFPLFLPSRSTTELRSWDSVGRYKKAAHNYFKSLKTDEFYRNKLWLLV